MPKGVTPTRETRVVFGEFPAMIQQPFFGMDRLAEEIGRGSLAKQQNVEYIPGIGFRLKSYALDPSVVYESVDGQDGILDGAAVNLAPKHEVVYTWANFDLPGVIFYGTPAQGARMIQKRPGNDSFDQRLSADQTAFPSPATGEDAANMDRVCVTVQPHNPDQLITFRFYVPKSALATHGALATFMFTGPAGSNSDLTGFGQYGLKFFGNGKAKLYERGTLPNGTTGWVLRATIPLDGIVGQLVQFSVVTNASESCQTGFKGNRISILSTQFPDPRNEGEGLIKALTSVAMATIARRAYVYKVPSVTDEPVQVAPVRVDIRRDMRAFFQISKTKHPETGSLTDEPFSVPFFPTEGSAPFQVEWYADTPAGASIAVKMFRADNDEELVGTPVFTDCLGGVKRFAVPADQPKTYYVKFEFAGNGDVTSTLLWYRVLKDGVFETPGGSGLTLPESAGAGLRLPSAFAADYSITSSSENPQEESAAVKIYDLTNTHPEIKNRTGTPFAIKVYESGSLVSVLHRGYIVKASSQVVVGEAGYSYPKEDSFALDVTTKGEWERAKRQLAPRRLRLWDAEASKPMKVTDVLLLLFKEMGYPGSSLDIPDLAVRMFGSEQDDIIIEPATPLLDLAVSLALDYLGGFLFFDPNAGAYGRWRLLMKKKAPYRILARFDPNHPGAMKLPHLAASYGTSTVDGQTVPHFPILKGKGISPPVTGWEPPEGNVVIVYGGSGSGNKAGTQSAARFQQIAINFESYNPLGLSTAHANYPDATSPDYLGEMVPIEVYDITLTTQEAVNWVCRRVFDYACYAKETYTFTAPLALVSDPDDPYQLLARPLRFLDAVQVRQKNGSWLTYVVAGVKSSWSRDNMQLATYELVRTTRINEYAIPFGATGFFELMSGLLPKAVRTSIGIPKRAGQRFSGQREISTQHSVWAGLPEIDAPKIQEIDPESPDFGKFYFMAGYDTP